MMMMMRFYQIFRYTYFTTRHVPVVDVSSVCALSGWIHLPVHTHTHTHTLYIYDQVGSSCKDVGFTKGFVAKRRKKSPLKCDIGYAYKGRDFDLKT